MDLDPTRILILRLIQGAGTDLKNASIAIGRNAAYLQQDITRGTPRVLPEDVREALATHLGVHAETLRPPRIEGDGGEGGQTNVRASPALLRGGRIPPAGFVAVGVLDVRASAGPGAIHDGLEEAKENWMFPESMIRHEFRAQPENLRVIAIDGDSMEPLLSSGDRILLDTSQRVPVPPGIFVIWDGMGILAKRVEHIPNSDPPTVVIKSVNPEYRSYERNAEEVNVIGRVIWMARRL